MNRNLKKVIGITTTAVTGMYIINQIVDYTAGQKKSFNYRRRKYISLEKW